LKEFKEWRDLYKLTYQDFEYAGKIKEKEYQTLREAMFDAKYIQSSIKGQVIKIESGETTYNFQQITDYWRKHF